MTKRNDAPSAAAKMRVMKRDRFRCTYCGVPGTDAELEVDHITPVAAGGSHHIANLTTACRKCNQAKGARLDFQKTPITMEWVAHPPVDNPRIPGSCLAWSEDLQTQWISVEVIREGALRINLPECAGVDMAGTIRVATFLMPGVTLIETRSGSKQDVIYERLGG